MNLELFGPGDGKREAYSLKAVHVERCHSTPSVLEFVGGLDVAGKDGIAKFHKLAAWWIVFGSVPLGR